MRNGYTCNVMQKRKSQAVVDLLAFESKRSSNNQKMNVRFPENEVAEKPTIMYECDFGSRPRSTKTRKGLDMLRHGYVLNCTRKAKYDVWLTLISQVNLYLFQEPVSSPVCRSRRSGRLRIKRRSECKVPLSRASRHRFPRHSSSASLGWTSEL